MSNVVDQIAAIERELLALTANQPPNPYSIVTYKVTRTTTVDDEVKTIQWVDGIKRFISVYVTSGTANAPILVDGSNLKIYVAGSSGITYEAISLGEFNLV